jgi:eukaryotic-like serine/threonine-protein kinase
MMEIIAGLGRRYAGSIEIEGVFWEQTVYPAHATFQAQIKDPAACDVVVCILWSRLGSPLPQDWPPRPDKTPYESGTVYEFETALTARREGHLPDIFMFRKLLPIDRTALDELIEAHPAERLRILDYLIRSSTDDSRSAIQLLDRFWTQWFYSPDQGFIAAFNTFDTADQFAILARQAIEEWLIAKKLVSRQPDWDIETQGSPYPGLEPFGEHHVAVFFGRSRVTERALALLRGSAEAGFAWLLVTGPSGSGKSSLMRAGVVPALTQDTALEVWRTAVVRTGSNEPLQSLVEAIAAPEVLGAALAAGDYPAAGDLARIARAAPAEFARTLIRALDRHGETVRKASDRNTPPLARLLLVVDQMEDLVLVPAASQEEFGGALMALLAAAGSRILIAGTLRTDLQEPLLKIPVLQSLVTLDKGGSELKVAPPGLLDMREVIEEPAIRAHLSFEPRESDGRSLAEELAAAVGGTADALPLLQMTLALLFGRRDHALGQMRWSDYDAIGGLAGAIANHAETVLTARPESQQNQLGPLLRQLTRVWVSIDGEIEQRPTELDEAVLSGERAGLAARLIEGRVLVADNGRIRVAHEALLRNWERAQALLAADLDLARLQERLRSLVRDWMTAGGGSNSTHLLPAGAQLAAAQEVTRRYTRAEIGEDLADFIAASIIMERRQRTRRQRVLALIAGGFAVLSCIAAGGGVYAWIERGRAERNYGLALGQATGSVTKLIKANETGKISTTLMRELMVRSQETVRALQSETDDVAIAQAELFSALSRAYISLDSVDTARHFADLECDLANKLLAGDPADPRRRRIWADSRARLSDALDFQGHLEAALKEARDSRTVISALASQGTGGEDLAQMSIAAHQQIGDLLRALGKFDDAAREYQAWIEESEPRQADDSNEQYWPRALAFGYQRVGDNLLIQGKAAEAAKRYEADLSIFSRLAANPPDNGLFREGLAVGHQRLGDALLAQGDRAGAADEFHHSEEAATRLVELDASNFRWREILAITHQRNGEVLILNNDYAGARAEFGLYLEMATRLRDQDDSNTSSLYDVANAHEKVGDLLRQQNDMAAAKAEYEQEQDIARKLVKMDASNAPWQKALATSFQRLGMTLEARQDFAGAREMFEKCGAVPVSPATWSLRSRWPADVVGYCRAEIAKLSR